MCRFTIRDMLGPTVLLSGAVLCIGCGQINHKIAVLKQGQRDVEQHVTEIDRAVQMTDPAIERQEDIEK